MAMSLWALALDVEVDHFDSQLLHVRNHVLRDFLGHALAVLYHFLEPDGSHDFTHVPFQNLGDEGDQLLPVHPQKGFAGLLEQLGVRAYLDIGHTVHRHVDEFIGGHRFAGLHVHLHHPQGQLVDPLEERNPPPGLTYENTLLAEAGDDVSRVRRRFQIPQDQQGDNGCDD